LLCTLARRLLALDASEALRERDRLVEARPRARELTGLLVAIGEIEQRADRGRDLLAREELRARLRGAMRVHRLACFLEELLGRGRAALARLGRAHISARRRRERRGEDAGGQAERAEAHEPH